MEECKQEKRDERELADNAEWWRVVSSALSQLQAGRDVL